jgi:hypothetical protein
MRPEPGVGAVYIDRRRRATMPYRFNVVELLPSGATAVTVHSYPRPERAEEARAKMIENARTHRDPTALADGHQDEQQPPVVTQLEQLLAVESPRCPDCWQPATPHKGHMVCANGECEGYGCEVDR